MKQRPPSAQRLFEVPRTRQFPVRWFLYTLGAALFIVAVLPLSQLLSGEPEKNLFVRSVDPSLPPPPPPPPEPPPPEEPEEQKQVENLEEPPPPLNLQQLEVALNPGIGGIGLEGASLDSFAAAPDMVEEIKVFTLAEVDRRPRLLQRGQFSMPRHLKQLRVEGPAEAEVVIDENGRVSVTRVLSSPHPDVNEAFATTLERSLFEAPTRNGEPVRLSYKLRLNLK